MMHYHVCKTGFRSAACWSKQIATEICDIANSREGVWTIEDCVDPACLE
jgi:hypothetical protein